MFERFTEKARRTIFSARAEAIQSGSKYIESDHLLLGILREQPGLLPGLDASAIEEIRADYAKRFQPCPKELSDLPLSHEAKRVLAWAVEEAEILHHNYIDCDHLLLGLLREERSEAASTLRSYGVDVSAQRSRLGGVTGHFSWEDLYALVELIPPERADAAERLLEALRQDTVKITVTHPAATFEISFGAQ